MHQINELQSKLDEANRTLNDFDAAKKKLAVENSDLLRQLEEAENQVGQLSKLKLSLTNQLEDTRKLADEESRVSILKAVQHAHKYECILFSRTLKRSKNIYLSF